MDVVLAFGGGGVKGAAHVGVLRVLEREGFQIKGIAGTSAGAMIAAFYCAGHSVAEIQDRLTHLDQSHLYQRRAGDGPSFLAVPLRPPMRGKPLFWPSLTPLPG